ncbi:uncharacterized protein PV06_08991 [Exophiala oligosperma]|uniref:AMP-dependent synthetase/ligase domain-containing protein n=1 Tax=Exophiala oligosperma TaxID=215243 RepID=A0A0D2AGE6_9EURO|nr:uncharacterized protein PV06_08991 [Exophiala oligosperma]KIW39196.1 hypothetical protein PV06_08991 [Exophiala oligosperma]
MLPSDIMFQRLHYSACHQNGSAVREEHLGLDVSYAQLLCDVIHQKQKLLKALNEQTLLKLSADEEVAFVIIARGYDFVAALFAVLAVGGIAVPTSHHVTLDEVRHIARTCRAHGVVHSRGFEQLTATIDDGTMFHGLAHVPIERMIPTKTLEVLRTVKFFAGRSRDPNKPAVIIFTSGTTGKPKGAALRRHSVLSISLAQVWKNDINGHFVALQLLPTHHATGLLVNTFPTLIGGGCVEFTRPKFDAAITWERIRRRGIKSLSAVPTIYVRLLQHWGQELEKSDSREEYRAGMCAVEQFHCGSAALPRHISSKWSEAFPGTRIIERYGGTEFGNPFGNQRGGQLVPGSVGAQNPGVESYLENGHEGEIHVRSPTMFSKYVYDIEGTRASLTPEGFFKTGDVAEKIDGHFFIKGRKSVDILKTGGYKVSALDIEREILQHPKVAEAIVVGLDDAEFGQRIAAAVVLHELYKSLSLQELRDDLRPKLSRYKLPTVLRVVPDLKKTASLKIPKALIKKELFETGHPDVQRWENPSAKL